MANLKNITDLPMAESAEGLNLIVNDNGAAKQIAAGAVGAQADWAETDETNPSFIKNKPEAGGDFAIVNLSDYGVDLLKFITSGDSSLQTETIDSIAIFDAFNAALANNKSVKLLQNTPIGSLIVDCPAMISKDGIVGWAGGSFAFFEGLFMNIYVSFNKLSDSAQTQIDVLIEVIDSNLPD